MNATPTTAPTPIDLPPLWATLVATWFGCGRAPRAPGTVGSLGALVVFAPLVLFGIHPAVRLAVAAFLFILGTLASRRLMGKNLNTDPQHIVVDEVVGVGLALAFAPPSWLAVALGFALFRLFDIWKPGPVGWADRRIKGALGVMLDDVVAGAMAAPLVPFLVFEIAHLQARAHVMGAG